MQITQNAGKKKHTATRRSTNTASDHLYHLAFDSSLQASIILTVPDGRIIDVNMAACKLLGYSKRELLTQSGSAIFNTTESSSKKVFAQLTMKGYIRAHMTVIKRSGKQLPCEITSVVFVGDHGITKAITTFVDLSENITKQKNIDNGNNFKNKFKNRQSADAVIEAHEVKISEIGKELHDNVNQLLGVSQLYLDMARKDGVNKEMCLNRCSEYTLAAIEEIRKISKGLVTDVIKDFGLGEAIDNISTDMMEVHPVKISCMVDHLIENRVNDKFKHDVFRIVQEQLTNIIKHAKASIIKISLSQTKNAIFLSISDDGAGFDTTQRQRGIGITNIKSRARFYTGNANFVSQPGKGCVLTVAFPVSDALLNEN